MKYVGNEQICNLWWPTVQYQQKMFLKIWNAIKYKALFGTAESNGKALPSFKNSQLLGQKNKGQVKGYRVEVSVFWKVFRYSILFKEPPDPADAKDANCQNGNGKYELWKRAYITQRAFQIRLGNPFEGTNPKSLKMTVK